MKPPPMGVILRKECVHFNFVSLSVRVDDRQYLCDS